MSYQKGDGVIMTTSNRHPFVVSEGANSESSERIEHRFYITEPTKKKEKKISRAQRRLSIPHSVTRKEIALRWNRIGDHGTRN